MVSKSFGHLLRALLLGAGVCIAAASVHAETLTQLSQREVLTPQQQKEFDALLDSWEQPPGKCPLPAYAIPVTSKGDLDQIAQQSKAHEDCLTKVKKDGDHPRYSVKELAASAFLKSLKGEQRRDFMNVFTSTRILQDARIDRKIRYSRDIVGAIIFAYNKQHSLSLYMGPDYSIVDIKLMEADAQQKAIAESASRIRRLWACAEAVEMHLSNSEKFDAMAQTLEVEQQRLAAAKRQLEEGNPSASDVAHWKEAVRAFNVRGEAYQQGVEQIEALRSANSSCSLQLQVASVEIDTLCKGGGYPKYCAFRRGK